MKHLPDESGVCACGFGRFGTGLVMICLFSMSITEQMQSDSTDQNSNEQGGGATSNDFGGTQEI